jgi:uncharacterized protein YndB with AHSA1/START domain
MSSEARAKGIDADQIRQIIDAAPDEVFAAWVTPETIEQWWGPDGVATVVKELDLVEGGRFAFEMIASDGEKSCMRGVYRRIAPPHLLEFYIDDHCALGLPPSLERPAGRSLVTVRISKKGRATEVVVTHAMLEPAYEELAVKSWMGALAKLSRVLHEQV